MKATRVRVDASLRRSPRIDAVLGDATRIARGQRHLVCCTDHVLLALLRTRGTRACRLLRRAGIDPATMYRALREASAARSA
jgi:hypothetical protein